MIHATRQGEHEVRSQGARDRRALTGEAGNASRRKVIVGATARSPEWASAWRTQDESGPTFSRVMRTNFVGTTAKIFREHSEMCHKGKKVGFVYGIDKPRLIRIIINIKPKLL